MRVLWIDDDEYRTKLVRENLAELYNCHISFYKTYIDGYTNLQKHKNNTDVVILDIMMPPGKMFNSDAADYGRVTGLLLYKKIREFYHGAIILYTNFRDRSTINHYIRQDPYVRYQKKPALAEDIMQKIFDAKRGGDFHLDE